MIPTYIKRPDGSIYINPAKRHVRSFWLTSQAPATVTPQIVPIAAGGTTNPIPFPIDPQGSLEIAYSMFEADDDRILINIFDPGTRRNLMNRPIPISAIAGTAERPFIWPETYFMNVQNGPRELQVTFTDFSGAPNNVRLVFFGRKFYEQESPPDVQLKMREYFAKKERTNVYWLTTNADFTVPAGGALLGPGAPILEATDEADTEVFKFTSIQDGVFECQLRELRNNRTMMNNPVFSTSIFGTGQWPMLLSESLLIERNYDIAFEVTDLSGAPNQIRPVFTCRRLYYS